MRVMILLKASTETETGDLPEEQLLADMGKFNEDLVNAGLMLAGEGLKPSSEGRRVRFSGSNRTVVNGPFPDASQLIAGFWIWQVKSMNEAIEWVKRIPLPSDDEEVEIEIRPIFESEDFGDEFTPALREHEERLRARVAERDAR